MLKILKGRKVYIPVSELKKKSIDIQFPRNVVEKSDLGDMVPESVFNLYLTSDDELLRKNDGYVEMTKVKSLSCEIEDLIHIRPLQMMFLRSQTGMDEETALKEIEKDTEKSIERTIALLMTEKPDLTDSFKKTVSLLEEHGKCIEEILGKYGLSLQFLTEIHNKAGLICFLAGENVFYQVYLDDWEKEDFERVRVDGDKITIPEPQEYEDTVEKVTDYGRDFRKYTVRENLAWCIQNLPLENEITDEVNYRKDSISFFVNIVLLVKLFNSASFPDVLFIDGIANVREQTILPEKE